MISCSCLRIINFKLSKIRKLMREHKSQSFVQKKRQWHHVIAPIVKFSRNSTLLGYPIDFFSSLEKILTSGYTLHLNIPNTLSGTHDNYIKTIFKDDEMIGTVSFKASLSKMKFQSEIEKVNKDSITQMKKTKYKGLDELFTDQEQSITSKSHWVPFIVVKEKNITKDRIELNTLILNNYECTKLANIEVYQIYQNYIFTKPPAASTTRFFYFPKEKENGNISRAFKIDNYEPFIKKKLTKTLWKVKQDSKYSCGFFKVMFTNKSFFQQTKNLVKGLEYLTKRGVSKIVTDWVLDNNNRYFLIDVKEVFLTDVKPICRVSRSLTEMLEIVSCSMCLQSFQKSKVCKVLTNNLILNFMKHLQKRGEKLSFKINYKTALQSYRVCQLCYNTVVTESKLIQMENLMAFACNTMKNKISSSKSGDENQSELNPQNIVKSEMHQWRLFFYLQQIKSLTELENLPKNQNSFLYVNMKVHDSITSFKLNIEPRMQSIQIKAIKVEYLFSDKEKIEEFLIRTEIRVRISEKAGWDGALAEGCIYGIYDETEASTINMLSQRRYKQILIFNGSSKYCVLGMYIGIHNDGIKNTKNLKLYHILDIYRPKNEYSDCLALPAEWMEIIEPNYCHKNLEAFKNEGEETKEPSRIRRSLSRTQKKSALLPSIPITASRKVLKL